MFGAPMVRAILAREKTQTRRLVRDAKDQGGVHKVGDLLWVRESWRASREYDDHTPKEILEHDSEPAIHYLADEDLGSLLACPQGKYRSARYMPQRLSRIVIHVRDVRVHKLSDISTVDASAEGAVHWAVNGGVGPRDVASLRTDAVRAFACLWETIHGLGSWERQANELVRAYTFDVLTDCGARGMVRPWPSFLV